MPANFSGEGSISAWRWPWAAIAVVSAVLSTPSIGSLAQPGDYVICLGAGSITQWAYALPGELAALDKA